MKLRDDSDAATRARIHAAIDPDYKQRDEQADRVLAIVRNARNRWRRRYRRGAA